MKFSSISTRFRNHSPRRGSVLPLVALCMVAMLGCASLAVDYAVLLADRNHLQRACDASALAGAAYLKRSTNETTNTTAATNQALLMAAQNKLTPGEVTASSITFLENNTKIRVEATRARQLFFARVLGITLGNVKASATALATPSQGPPVPIAITTVSRDRYQEDGLPHNFTLIRPQESAFATNYAGLTAYDPFTVFDLRGNQAKSSPHMTSQLTGDLSTPVNPQIGDTLTGMALSLDTLAGAFKEGIGPRFTKAAAEPWRDPGTIAGLAPWQLVGTRIADVLSGNIASNNPRIVRFVVLNEVNSAVSNYDYTIVGFAPAYIHSVQDVAGKLTLTATFLPPGAASEAPLVSLVE